MSPIRWDVSVLGLLHDSRAGYVPQGGGWELELCAWRQQSLPRAGSSWLDHCWAPGSVFSWKLWAHTVISGHKTLWKCLRGAVQHGHCASAAVLLSGLSPPLWGQGAHPGHETALKLPGLPLVLCCPPQTHLVLGAGSLVSSCANAQSRAGQNKLRASWP